MEQQHSLASSSSSAAGGDGNAERSPSFNTESRSGVASSSSQDTRGFGSQRGREEDDGRHPLPPYNYNFTNTDFTTEQLQPRRMFLWAPSGGSFNIFNDSSISDDTWSCVIVIFTFWFFVSLTLILGVYGAENYSLGPYSSMLLETNSLFVQSVKVVDLDDPVRPGLNLYGLYKPPALNQERTWSISSQNYSISADSHKDWVYYLNTGSQINVTYSLNPTSSYALLVIAEGNEGYSQWLDDPVYPNTTLSWNMIHGSGHIFQPIYQSSTYWIALGNVNLDNVEVEMNMTVKSSLYDTSEAYYQCSVGNGECGIDMPFPWGISTVLASQVSEPPSSNNEWYVKVIYGPRWSTYIVGIGGMTLLMLAIFNLLSKCRPDYRIPTGDAQMEGERAPLLQPKDDDMMSCDSSFESSSGDEKDLEEFLAANSIQVKQSKEGEIGNNTRRLCAICYDAPRDCFFLPCGHCVSCFDCGTRIFEVAGICPVCRRNMKKVKKIFTV